MNTLPKSLSKENVEVIRELFNWLIQPCLGESSAAHRSTGQLPKPPDHLNHQPPARITHQPLKNPTIQTTNHPYKLPRKPFTLPTTLLTYSTHQTLKHPKIQTNYPNKHTTNQPSKPETTRTNYPATIHSSNHLTHLLCPPYTQAPQNQSQPPQQLQHINHPNQKLPNLPAYQSIIR